MKKARLVKLMLISQAISTSLVILSIYGIFHREITNARLLMESMVVLKQFNQAQLKSMDERWAKIKKEYDGIREALGGYKNTVESIQKDICSLRYATRDFLFELNKATKDMKNEGVEE